MLRILTPLNETTTARFKLWEVQCVYSVRGYTEDILAAVTFVLPDMLLAPW